MTIPDRIALLLTRDYHGDEVTQRHCHRLANYASRFYTGHDEPRMIVESAEHMAALSEQLRKAGKVAVLRSELDRSVR